tara:strand:- start:31435 stop:32649 length:1215 start_codon:yes stop_codon:yes gene_type:complete
MKFLNAKGTKDVLVEEKLVMDDILNTIKNVFELYGYGPLETPMLERFEVLSSKDAGGSEILKETFQLKDQGKRLLGLRYDLTVPLARFIAMNSNLKLPFKRYQIGKVFRDGPVSSNRIREFTQCDVDVVGSNSLGYDAEMLAVAYDIFKRLGFKFRIKVNNRKILDSLLDELKVENKEQVILEIDKLDKIGDKEVIKNITKLTSNKIAKKIIKKIKSKNLKLKNNEGIEELNEVVKYLKLFGVKNVLIDYSLARGLSYYTGTVFEVFTDKKESIAGGGRYDNMISKFCNKNVPAVGISFGLNRIYNSYNKDFKRNITNVYLIPINTFKDSIKILNELRNNDIRADIDLSNKNLSKNLNYVNKKGIPFSLFIGKKELNSKKLRLKDMKTGKERLMSLNSIIKILK